MIYICKEDVLGEPCNCCISVSGQEPPNHPCARGHKKWKALQDERECDCWMGEILPGQKPC